MVAVECATDLRIAATLGAGTDSNGAASHYQMPFAALSAQLEKGDASLRSHLVKNDPQRVWGELWAGDWRAVMLSEAPHRLEVTTVRQERPAHPFVFVAIAI